MSKDCHLALSVGLFHFFFIADHAVYFNRKFFTSWDDIDMILDHHCAELREDQFALLPVLVRYCSFLVHLVYIDVLVALVVSLAEVEQDFNSHAQNGLVEAEVLGLSGQLTSFEEPCRERYFDWLSYIRIAM